MSRLSYKSAEPSIPSTTEELTNTQFITLMNWYSSNYKSDMSVKYFSEYLKTQKIEYIPEKVSAFISSHPNIGYLCRIQMRGAKLSESTIRWLMNNVESFRTFIKPIDFYNDRPTNTEKKIEKPTLSIQERMKQQVSKCLGELEGCVDEVILSNFKTMPSPLVVMRNHQIKGPQAQQIIVWFKRIRDEYQLAHSGTDADLRDAYSNFTKSQLNKLANYCDQIINDGLLIVKESIAIRSPRKRKKQLPEQIAKRVHYQPKYEELGLISLEPREMVGSLHAWTYHTKTRTLTLHVADDASGLSFKGTTVKNTNTSLCITKKLRKPKDTLHEVINGGKTITKKLMESLTTKSARYKNRLNKETIIVRCHK